MPSLLMGESREPPPQEPRAGPRTDREGHLKSSKGGWRQKSLGVVESGSQLDPVGDPDMGHLKQTYNEGCQHLVAFTACQAL